MRRHLLPLVLFGIATLVACGGGGGGSPVVPHAGSGSGNGSGPSTAKTTRATMVMYIPPPARQSAKKPYYISSSTQSFGVLVVPVGSTQTPTPLNVTIFPVATPSPCAAASGGGETCTLTVQAPFGNDIFYVAAFASASPNANAIPLSEYISGAIDVSSSPSPNATPMSFTLNGVVASLTVTVPSPDPPASNTQLFPIGTAAPAQPLLITARDSSNAVILADATNTFAQPVVLNVSPASEGVNLALTTSTCGSGTGTPGSSITIACAGDLNNAVFTYDGSIHQNTSQNAVDTFTIADGASPQPSPATIGLTSALFTTILDSSSYPSDAYIAPLSNNTFVWLSESEGSAIGTYNATSRTAGTVGIPNGVEDAYSIASDTAGRIWIDDDGSLDCYASTSAAMGGATPSPYQLSPTAPGGDPLSIGAIAIDASDNLWYVGYDTSGEGTGQTYTGYINVSSGCVTPPSPPPAAQFTLAGDTYDYGPYVNALPNGGIAITSTSYYNANGLYQVTMSSPSNVSPSLSALSGASGAGAAVDTAGNRYAAFISSSSNADLETGAAGVATLSSLLGLPPTSTDYAPEPEWLTGFAAATTIDRLAYTELDYDGLGLIFGLPSSPLPTIVLPSHATNAFQTIYGSDGLPNMLYDDTSGNLDVVRVVPTTHWSVPATSFSDTCGSSAVVAVVERTDSGPFTMTAPPTDGVTIASFPGSDHDFYVTLTGSSTTLTVTDAHGRSENVPITITSAGECGAAHRRLSHTQRLRNAAKQHPH